MNQSPVIPIGMSLDEGGSSELTQEQIDAIALALAGQLSPPDPRTNGGRLVVPPAYMNTTGDSALQLNTVDKKALFGWTQEVSHVIPAISVYATAVGTAGELTIEIYEADSSGDPTGTVVYEYDPVEITTTNTWYRFEPGEDPGNLVPGKRYVLVGVMEADADVSLSYNCQDTGQLSGLVPGCWSKISGSAEEKYEIYQHSNNGAATTPYSYRIVIPAGTFGEDGTSIQFAVQGAIWQSLYILHASVVERDGQTANGTTTPTQVLFDANPGATVSPNVIKYCDKTAYVWNDSVDHIITVDLGYTDGFIDVCYTLEGLGETYVNYNDESYNEQTVIGYSLINRLYILSSLKVYGSDLYSDLSINNEPALLNVVLASKSDHTPQLVYGWDGKHGNKVAIYNLTSAAWELNTIPDTGVFKDCAGIQHVTVGVFLYSDVTLELDFMSSSDQVFKDGIRIGPGGNDDLRFLGLMATEHRIGTIHAPIRCDTYNSLWNAENQTEQVMYRQPFSPSGVSVEVWVGSGALRPGRWGRLSETDYQINVLTGNSVLSINANVEDTTNVLKTVSIGIDNLESFPTSSVRSPPYVSCEAGVSEGLHSIFLLYRVINTVGCRVWQDDGNSWGYVRKTTVSCKYMG